MSTKKSAAKASRLGALGFTLVALILSIVTAVLLSQMFRGTRLDNEELKPVVVAKTDIPASKRLTDDVLTVVQWPKSSVPKGAYSALDQLLGITARVPVDKIYKGEPILSQRLAAPGQGTGMASLLPANYRGFPVPDDNWIADAKLVLQRVPVLAVDGKVDIDQMADDGKKKKRRVAKSVVTLLVTPDQGEALALASREGKVDLLLRNAQDEGVVETLGIDPLDLLGQADPEDVEAAEAALAAAKKAEAEAAREPKTRRRRGRRRRTRTTRAQRKAMRGPEGGSGQNTGGTKVINLGGN
jgi:pilus assembly protein CpaB